MDQEQGGVHTSLYSILCIVVRLGAVMLALTAFRGAIGFFSAGNSSNFTVAESMLVVGALGLYLLVAFLLWLYPGPLARLASGRSANQIFESSINAAQIQWIALSILGMYWVIIGILDLANFGIQYFWFSEVLGSGAEAARRLQWRLANDVVEIAIGFGLTLGARGLANFLQKARYAGSSGMDRRSPTSPDESE